MCFIETSELFRTTLVTPGVEVVTVHDVFSGNYVSTIHGGTLDGEEITSVGDADPDRQHDHLCEMVLVQAHEENRKERMLERMRGWRFR